MEYRGDEFLYAFRFTDETSAEVVARVFNQTSGEFTSEAEEIELNTKDRSGSGYGNITKNFSMEGVLTKDDPAITHVEQAQDNKELVEVLRINTRTLEAKAGKYVITNFTQSGEMGEWATYSIEGVLDGVITSETLTEVPTGAGTP